MTSVVTTSRQHGYRDGDRLTVGGDSNRVQTKVSKVISATAFEIEKFYRASRGYARHVRRLKQQRRSK